MSPKEARAACTEVNRRFAALGVKGRVSWECRDGGRVVLQWKGRGFTARGAGRTLQEAADNLVSVVQSEVLEA